MVTPARELEAFFSRNGRKDLAKITGGLLVEAQAIEAKTGVSVELPQGLRTEILTSEPLKREQFVQAFAARNIRVSRPYGQDLVDRIEISGEPQDLKLVWPSSRDLGLRQAVPYRRFLEAGQAAGLSVLRPERGLYLRLQDINQPLGDYYWIAMEPVPDRDGYPLVLKLERNDLGLWLHADWVDPGSLWDPGYRLVFGYSK